LFEPTQSGKLLADALKSVLQNEISKGPFRLIGLNLGDLVDASGADKGDLLGNDNSKSLQLEKALDKIYDKFGKNAITPFDRIEKKHGKK